MTEMTKDVLVASCKANGGYAAPALNDQLFLQCKGFLKIENLEPYTELKVLWLEQNALIDLDGLSGQQNSLISLLLQNNTLRSLHSLTYYPLYQLRIINISFNYISNLKGLAIGCPQLETLQASHNVISSLEACEDLFELSKTLTSVDLSFNKITLLPMKNDLESIEEEVKVQPTAALITGTSEASQLNVEPKGSTRIQANDPSPIINFFQKLPSVSVIYLQGNPLLQGLKSYRKKMILNLPALTYLDERPVFKEERRVVEAWGRGGEEEELNERKKIREEKKNHLSSCVKVLTDKMEANRAVRDQLTRKWEEKNRIEIEESKKRRKESLEAIGRLEVREQMGRENLEKAEDDAYFGLMEEKRAAKSELMEHEKENRHRYEQDEAVKNVTNEVLHELTEAEYNEKHLNEDDLKKCALQQKALDDLWMTDKEVLMEMEENIYNAFHIASPDSESEKTSRGQRAAFKAISSVSNKWKVDHSESVDEKRNNLYEMYSAWARH